jgi:hypothetical protein
MPKAYSGEMRERVIAEINAGRLSHGVPLIQLGRNIRNSVEELAALLDRLEIDREQCRSRDGRHDR